MKCRSIPRVRRVGDAFTTLYMLATLVTSCVRCSNYICYPASYDRLGYRYKQGLRRRRAVIRSVKQRTLCCTVSNNKITIYLSQ